MKTIVLLVTLALVIPVYSQAPTLAPLPKETEYHLLALYSKALLAQSDVNAANARLQEIAKEYNDFAAKAIEDGKYPKGTTLQPNVPNSKVDVVPPASKAEPKTEKK